MCCCRLSEKTINTVCQKAGKSMMTKLKLPSAVIGATAPAVTNGWANDLFLCCDAPQFGPNCVVQSCFCTPCLVSSAMGWSECSNPALVCISLTFCANTPCPLISSYVTRRHVVDKYNIQEDVLVSGAISLCCLPCSLIQVHSKVALEETLTYGCGRLVPAQSGVTPNSMER